jgi:hypothetical protein
MDSRKELLQRSPERAIFLLDTQIGEFIAVDLALNSSRNPDARARAEEPPIELVEVKRSHRASDAKMHRAARLYSTEVTLWH